MKIFTKDFLNIYDQILDGNLYFLCSAKSPVFSKSTVQKTVDLVAFFEKILNGKVVQ